MGSTMYVRNDVISISTFTLLVLFLVQPTTAQLNVFPYCVTSCAGRATGQYANCFSCRLFVYCSNERLFNSPCLGLLEYDAIRGVCDFPFLAQCRTSSATSATTSMTSPATTSVTSQPSPASMTSRTSPTSDSSPDSDSSASSASSPSSEVSPKSATSRSSPGSESSPSSPSSPTSDVSDISATSYFPGDIYCVTNCNRVPQGFYPSCADCGEYYRCNGGDVGELKTCSPGLGWSPEGETCDLLQNVNCSVTSLTSQSSPSSENSPGSDRSIVSRASASSEASLTSQTSPISDISPAPDCLETCGSQPFGDYPYCLACDKYVRCSGGSTDIRQCTSPLVFNATFESCAYESTCTFTSPQSAVSSTSEPVICALSCVGAPDGDTPACDDCSAYYRCSGGSGTRQICSSGLAFDPELIRCADPANVNCTFTSASSQSSAQSDQSEMSDQSVTSGTSPISMTSEAILCVLTCVGTPAGNWAACDLCTDFFRCEGGDAGSRMTCSSGLLFSTEISNCATPDSVNCTFTSPTSLSSPSSLQSPSSGSSELSEISDTSASSPESPTSEGIYCVESCVNVPFGDWPVCDDCMDYFRCDGTGNGLVKSCSPTLMFDPEERQCAPEADVMCRFTSPSSPSSPSSEVSESSASSPRSVSSPSSGTSPSSPISYTSEPVFCLDACDDHTMGDYAACDSCSHFYRCIGSGERRECTSPLLFNPEQRQCDVPGNVTCFTTSASSPSSPASATSGFSDQSLASSLSNQSDTSEISSSSEMSPSSGSSESSESSEPSDQSDQSMTSDLSATSEAITCVNSCAGVPMSDFLNCADCMTFYRCDGSGSGQLRSCASSLLFSAELGRCDVAENVTCLTTSGTSAQSESSVTSNSSPSSASSIQSVSSEQSDQSVTSGSSATSLTSGSSEAIYCITDCASHPPGRYSDCDSCFYYHICRGSSGSRESCNVQGLLFDAQSKQCGIAANVMCATNSPTSQSSESSPTSATPSPTSNTSMTSESSPSSESSLTSLSSESSESSPSSASSPESPTSAAIFCLSYSSSVCSTYNLMLTDVAECSSCDNYIRCDENMNTERATCGTGLRFNPDTNQCDFDANVMQCATTSASSASSDSSPSSLTSLSSETSEQSMTSETSPNSPTSEAIFCLTSCANAPIGDWPDCNDCGMFYRCDGAGSGSMETCGSELLQFNPAIYDCDLFSNVNCATTSASSATSEPSVNSDSPSSVTSQQSDLSVTSQKSPSSEAVFCTTSCDGMPFGRFADCNDCSGFYSCGMSSTMESCSPLLFNPTTTACDLPANVVCATTSASSATSEPSQQSVTSFTPSSTSITSEPSDQSILSITSMLSPSSERIDCINSTDTCTSVAVGDYTFCNDRSMYIRCNVDTAVIEDCGSPLIFDGLKCAPPCELFVYCVF